MLFRSNDTATTEIYTTTDTLSLHDALPISFSPPDGAITLRARREGAWVIATIEDDGPGIPPAKLEAIFDRFYTERPAGEKFGTHSGLGLSISKQIITAHRGQIFSENREGRPGARFTVKIPAK